MGWPLYTIDNKIVVDRIFHYEALADIPRELSGILQISETLSLPEIRFKGTTRPKGSHYRDIIDPASRRRIEELFRREIEAFGYSF